MKYVECSTQADLDKAIASKKSDEIIVCTGGTVYNPMLVSGSAQVRAYGSAQVEAYGSAQVEAYDSAQVEAYDSVQVEASGSVQVRASGSAQVRAYDSAQVEAYGSAQVRAYDSVQVRAYDSAQVEAYGSAQVEASKYVAVTKRADSSVKVAGGVVIEIPPLTTTDAWLDYYGISVTDGIAILYKAVDDQYGANHNGFKYEPGTAPEAPDWKPTKACGNGLHFCARPLIARDKYHPSATRFIACPVSVADLIVIDESKVKAPRVAKPCFEVDKHGDPIAELTSENAA